MELIDVLLAGPLGRLLLTPENAVVGAIAYAIVSAARRVAPRLFDKALTARLLPLLPFLVTSALVWVPLLRNEQATSEERFLVGVLLGYLVAHNHKILTQTVLGKDRRVRPPAQP